MQKKFWIDSRPGTCRKKSFIAARGRGTDGGQFWSSSNSKEQTAGERRESPPVNQSLGFPDMYEDIDFFSISLRFIAFPREMKKCSQKCLSISGMHIDEHFWMSVWGIGIFLVFLYVPKHFQWK